MSEGASSSGGDSGAVDQVQGAANRAYDRAQEAIQKAGDGVQAFANASFDFGQEQAADLLGTTLDLISKLTGQATELAKKAGQQATGK